MAKSMEHFVFVNMANLTLIRRDSYLSHLPDTLSALRTAPLQLATLFPDNVIKQAEEDIASYDSKGCSGSSYRKGCYHPNKRSERNSDRRKTNRPAWKTFLHMVRADLLSIHPIRPKASSRINDHHSVNVFQTGLLAGAWSQETVQLPETLSVKTLNLQT